MRQFCLAFTNRNERLTATRQTGPSETVVPYIDSVQIVTELDALDYGAFLGEDLRTHRAEPLGIHIEQLTCVAVDCRKEFPHSAEARPYDPDSFARRNEMTAASCVWDITETSGIGTPAVLAP